MSVQPTPVGKLADAYEAVRALLSFLEVDPDSDGLRDTPSRVTRALIELTAGYADDPADILAKRFEGPYDEIVLMRDIEFVSLCEHHLMPFTGVAHVGYIADGSGVVGISKLARLVQCFARRLQIQERMTAEIAQALQDHLSPKGVGVVVKASHACMACRGVRQARSALVTSAMLGALRENPETRAEFLTLCGGL